MIYVANVLLLMKDSIVNTVAKPIQKGIRHTLFFEIACSNKTYRFSIVRDFFFVDFNWTVISSQWQTVLHKLYIEFQKGLITAFVSEILKWPFAICAVLSSVVIN